MRNIPHIIGLAFVRNIPHTQRVEFIIVATSEFNEWFSDQGDMIKGLVRARFSRIEVSGHFGIVKPVGDGVNELKWKNGLRIYFAYLESKKIIILLGGTKNGQKKDIKKAKSLLG